MNRSITKQGGYRAPRLPAHVASAVASAILTILLSWPGAADASILSGEALDTAANVLSWVVLVIVPIVVIVVFWIVHVMPEKIAHKRHHPQRQAIQTLCLLSLVFGGLLWPIAWLWAYTKPIGYKLAYGTEKHEDYFHESSEKLRAGELGVDEMEHLRDELEAVQARGPLPPTLRALRDEVEAALTVREPKVAAVQARSA
jgi:CBS domain containing-hemolysin-like protein